MQDPQPDFRPQTGVPEELSPGLRRILAPNPSPMTYRGTNSYVLGHENLAVIDPGPLDMDHLDALLAAVGPGQSISHILVTHAHIDHSPLARPLAEKTGAPIMAFGAADAGRSVLMQRLAAQGALEGGEGVDDAFAPDVYLSDGDSIDGGSWRLEVIHTPGHMANHISFAWGDVLFSGDLVMGWASSLVSPPDGDLGAFMRSLRRLQGRDWACFHAGHGAPVQNPSDRLAALLAHRLGRESSILEALSDGPADTASLAQTIYVDTPAALLPAAERNILAHLIDLTERNRVVPIGALSARAQFACQSG